MQHERSTTMERCNPYITRPGFASGSRTQRALSRLGVDCTANIFTRGFDNCFEMYDGDAVVWALMHAALNGDDILAAGIKTAGVCGLIGSTFTAQPRLLTCLSRMHRQARDAFDIRDPAPHRARRKRAAALDPYGRVRLASRCGAPFAPLCAPLPCSPCPRRTASIGGLISRAIRRAETKGARMGLDMYAYTVPRDLIGADVDIKLEAIEHVSEFHYWRKHPNLRLDGNALPQERRRKRSVQLRNRPPQRRRS